MDIDKLCIEYLKKSLRPIPQELNEVDWKVGLTSKKERLKKHLSAFSNLSGGGFLIFGVSDDGKIVGIDEERSREIADILANMARTALEPQINIKFVTFHFNGHPLLGAFIEESFEKPVHIKNKGIERAYIRAGGQSRQMSKEEVRWAIMSSRSVRFGEIPAALAQEVLHSWEDYFDFSQVIKRTRPGGFQEQESWYDHLYSLKLLTKVNAHFVPTNLAIICCAKDLTKLHSYEKFAVRMVEYFGKNKISGRRDISFNRGYTLDLDQIVVTLSSWLPQKEVIDMATSYFVPVIPEMAMREIIVNAIIHRDFTKNDSYILIEVFSDRVEVTNPGGLLPDISVDRLIDHPSQTRNEEIADLMRKLNFAEERGSGIDKAVIAMEKNGLPPIRFVDGRDYFSACLYSEKSFDDMDKEERINAVFQHACLNVVIQRKTTNRSIRERLKLSTKESTKIYRLINDAIDVGKIKPANHGAARKDQYYLPYWM